MRMRVFIIYYLLLTGCLASWLDRAYLFRGRPCLQLFSTLVKTELQLHQLKTDAQQQTDDYDHLYPVTTCLGRPLAT